MAYTTEDKAQAIAIIERFGGLTSEAINLVRQTLDAPNLSKSTLHGWTSTFEQSRTEPNRKKEPNRAVSESHVEAANAKLDDLFEQVARRYLSHALDDETIKGTKGKDAVIAAATATDKMRLLRDLPTEIVQVLPTLILRLEALGINASDYFNAHMQELDRAYREQLSTSGQ